MDTDLSKEELAAFLQMAEKLISEDDSNIFTTRSPEQLLQFREKVASGADFTLNEMVPAATVFEGATRRYG
jgi:hypothetical protein